MTGFIVGVVLGSVMGAIVFGLFHNAIDNCDRDACRHRTDNRKVVREYMARQKQYGRRWQ